MDFLFNPERKFWIALAGTQIERFVKGTQSQIDCFQISGDLMSWSRFLEALQPFGAMLTPVDNTAKQAQTRDLIFQSASPRKTAIPSQSNAVPPDAEVPVEILEELALRKRS